MIWVAWRQFRLQFFIAVGLMIVLAVLVILTGVHVHDSLHLNAGCARQFDECASDSDATPLKSILGPLLLAIPALLGMFWGAPLVAREYEAGTYRLAFTQSISRRRWLTAKLLVVGVAALVIAGLASWLISWWYAPYDAVNLNRLAPSVFTERGIVAIGYTAFACALGVAAGAALRRVIPAMVATLVGYAAVREGFALWVRPSLLPDAHAALPAGGLYSLAKIRGAWTLSTRNGHPEHLTAAAYHRLMTRSCWLVGQIHCRSFPKLKGPLPLHYITYQPAGHYWPLQFIEMGVFALVGLAIAGATLRAVGPRLRHQREAEPMRAALRLLPVKTPDHPERDPASRGSA